MVLIRWSREANILYALVQFKRVNVIYESLAQVVKVFSLYYGGYFDISEEKGNKAGSFEN